MVVFVARLAGVSLYTSIILRVNAPSVPKSRRFVIESYKELVVVGDYYESWRGEEACKGIAETENPRPLGFGEASTS